MKKFLTLATLATFALTGCNNDNDVPTLDAGSSEILFGAQALTADTKAPFEGEISGSNALTAKVIGSKSSNDYTTIYTDASSKEATGDITFIDNGTTESGFPTGVKWPAVAETVVYFRGFYPGTTTWTAEATSATATVDGKTDLMVAPQISASSSTVAGSPLVFQFSHLLTKLHVKVVGTSATADDWGTITSIELSKAVNVSPTNKVTYTYNGNAPAFSETSTIPFYLASVSNSDPIKYTDSPFAAQTYAVPADGTQTLVAYALVAPVTGVTGNGDAKDEYTLKITTSASAGSSGKEVPINLKAADGSDFIGSTAGKKFDITIQFRSNGQILASATVTPWVDGGSGSGVM